MTYDAVGSFVCSFELLAVALNEEQLSSKLLALLADWSDRSEMRFDEIKCGCNYS